MRLLSRIVLFIAFLALLIPQTVFAEDYVHDAIEALKQSNVYVAPGTKGVDYDTPSKLMTFLGSDNIVLVMLPSEAIEGTDMYAIAQKISVGLDNQKTIGLAVGREVIGYSPILPEGVAADKMKRADSVSNDSVTALITFTQNIHSWLVNNPQPSPTPAPTLVPTPQPTMRPIVLPKVSDAPGLVWALILGCLLVVAAAFVVLVIKAARLNQRRKKFKPIENLINKIRGNVLEIKDRKVRDDLLRACQVASGLLEIFQEANEPLGYAEAKFPVLLSNMDRQIVAFIRHESGRRPLPTDLLDQLRKVLLNYDSLFVKLQENDPDAVELLTSIMDSDTTMIGRLGYLSED